MEFWSICELKNGNKRIQIESHHNSVFYQEIYFEKNGKLVYAKETENYMPINHLTQIGWNCQFFIQNGELVSYISLGHGKTETDSWNPNSIFEIYRKRMSELDKIRTIE